MPKAAENCLGDKSWQQIRFPIFCIEEIMFESKDRSHVVSLQSAGLSLNQTFHLAMLSLGIPVSSETALSHARR